MKRSKNVKKKQGSRTRPPERTSRRGWTSAMLSGVTLGVTVGACLWGASLVNRRASVHLSTTESKISIEWPSLEGAPGQTWLPEDTQHELLAIAYDRIERAPFSPLDPAPLGELARDLTATGWFEKIERVERAAGGEVRVRGEWRVPTAWIRHNERDYLIAAGGEVLPTAWAVEETSLPRVISVKSPPPSTREGRVALGEKWKGDDLRAGLMVLRLLGRYPFASQVRAVDVAGYSEKKRIELVTDRGTRVVWGAAPGDFKPGEVSTQVKLERLSLLASGREYSNRIDAGEERLEICGPYMEVVRVAGREEP